MMEGYFRHFPFKIFYKLINENMKYIGLGRLYILNTNFENT